ncbi:MFS transporter [Pseudoalteromonas obscura]|uniref:MFS transporter n=1 Tax=Pseudoalteromonas obscura TaxID=3048491 RepID=A0ABT7EMG7_9GAMM|nr:MFS transporter [Pseudoalteromonas sp. P94(2023)]MDK2596257.1 MFS transporter [Pseudoalteromonas sp. P94(2023)]
MNRYIALAAFLLSCSQLASQIFMPVLPDITQNLALTEGASQAIIISFFVSLGAAQLIAGPLCDKYGSRPIFICGQIILVLGTLLCALASDANTFLAGRVLQGIGSAAPVLVSRAILYATFKGNKLNSSMGNLAISASLVALITPLISGTLADMFSWQGMSFALIVYYGFVMVFGLIVFPTQQSSNISLRPAALVKQYVDISLSRFFVSMAVLKWAPTFLYLTIQLYFPFLLRNQFGFTTEQIGQAMTVCMGGLLIGSSLAKAMQKRVSHLKVVVYLWPALPISALTFLFFHGSVYAVIFAYCAILFIFGGYFPSYMYYVGHFHTSRSSTANALVGATELLIFSVIAWLANQYLISGPDSISIIVATISIIVLLAAKHLSFAAKSNHCIQGEVTCNSKPNDSL